MGTTGPARPPVKTQGRGKEFLHGRHWAKCDKLVRKQVVIRGIPGGRGPAVKRHDGRGDGRKGGRDADTRKQAASAGENFSEYPRVLPWSARFSVAGDYGAMQPLLHPLLCRRQPGQKASWKPRVCGLAGCPAASRGVRVSKGAIHRGGSPPCTRVWRSSSNVPVRMDSRRLRCSPTEPFLPRP